MTGPETPNPASPVVWSNRTPPDATGKVSSPARWAVYLWCGHATVTLGWFAQQAPWLLDLCRGGAA